MVAGGGIGHAAPGSGPRSAKTADSEGDARAARRTLTQPQLRDSQRLTQSDGREKIADVD